MYSLHNTIPNIRHYAINDKGEVFINYTNKITDINNNVLFSSTEDLQEIYYNRPFLYANDINGNGIILYDNSIKKINNAYIIECFGINILVDINSKTFLYNFKQEDFIQLLNFSIFRYLLFNNHIFYENSGVISKKHIFKREEIWNFPYHELNYNKVKFMNIINKKLFISCNNVTILSLDINDGSLLYRYDIIKDCPHLQPYLQDNTVLSYSIKDDNLIIFTRVALFQINLTTNKIQLLKDYISVPTHERWIFTSATIQENRIYFTGDLGGKFAFATRIGIIDVNTGKVLWHQHLNKKVFLPDAPQMNNNKIYVTAVNADNQQKDLYILEKEEAI